MQLLYKLQTVGIFQIILRKGDVVFYIFTPQANIFFLIDAVNFNVIFVLFICSFYF